MNTLHRLALFLIAASTIGDFSIVELAGKGEGGTVVFYSPVSRDEPGRCVEVQSATGDSARVIIQSFCEEIGGGLLNTPNQGEPDEDAVVAEIPGLTWLVAGSDMGFTIPSPPKSVTLRGTLEDENSTLNWENSEQPISPVWLFEGAFGSDGVIIGEQLNFSKSIRSENPFSKNIRMVALQADIKAIRLAGFEGRMRSAEAAIICDGARQHECFNIPFTNGIAPNWMAWTRHENNEMLFEMGRRGDAARDLTQLTQPSTPDEKVFFQQIQVGKPGAVGGTKRRFIGLRSERAYRLSARLNTMGLNNDAKDWRYSLHATYATRAGLTPDQLAGATALANGENGPDAARMVAYSPEYTTRGDWVRTDTGPNEALQDIVLPEGYDTIVLWVRYTAHDPDHVVGIDWVQLEDLGPVAGQDSAAE